MKYTTLVLSALAAFTALPARADNFVTITPTGSTAAAVANRWVIGSDLSGLSYIDGNSGFAGATATNFFTINGAGMPALGSPTGFTSYLPTGAATAQASVGNALTPNSYSGLTYVAENLSLIGPLSFYAIHHRTTGDYLALIQPSVPTVSDQKPMSAPGGPLTLGASGYFALSYAADDAGGWGAQLFYYLRTNGLGETIFGSLIPALLSGPTDRWNLGAGRGFTDLAYTSTNVGFGFGASQFYYLRLDPLTQTTFFGRLDPLTGVATDIQDLGGVYRTLVFTPTNVAYGANNFYSIGRLAQTITFAPISNHTTCDAPFTFVLPLASSGLPVTLAVSGPATISGNTLTLTGALGTVVVTASQAGTTTIAPALNVAQSFAVTACATPLTSQTITFPLIPGHTACDAPFTFVFPLASSGLPVTLAVSGPATVSGNSVTLTGVVGTVVLTASQAGNTTFAPAPNVAQTFVVAACVPAPTPQSITFSPVADHGLCDAVFTVNPTASSGLPVTLVVLSGPATVSGNTVTLTGAGSVTLQASQAGNATFAAATSVSQTFTAAKCAASITLDHLIKAFYGTPFNALNCVIATTTPAGLTVIITYNGSTTLPAAVGSYAVVATIDSPVYAGTITATLVLTPDPRLPQTVSFGVPPITNHVFGDAPFTLNPTASSGMPTTLVVISGPATVSGNTVTMTGAGNVTLEVSQAGNIATYMYASLTQNFAVARAVVPITLSNLAQAFDGAPKSVTAVTTPAGLTVNLTYNGSPTAPSAAGAYAVHATVDLPNYQGSADATLAITPPPAPPPVVIAPPPVVTLPPPTTFVIAPPAATTPVASVKISQTITFSTPVSSIIVNQPFPLGATASSSLPIIYSVVSGNATIDGNMLTINSTAPVVVRASQAGDDSTAPTSSDVTFTAQKASQSISIPSMGEKLTTDRTVTLSATANSGLPVSYTLVSGPASLSGNALTLNGAAGIVTVRVSQAGNGAFDAGGDTLLTFAVRSVGQQVYLGKVGSDTFAVIASADNLSGIFLIRFAATGEAIVARFKLNADGTFRGMGTSSLPVSLGGSPANPLPIATVAPLRTISGTVMDGRVVGSIGELGTNFSANVAAPIGSTAALAGVYNAIVPGSASGETLVVAGPAGEAFAVSITSTSVSSGLGSISPGGVVNITTSSGTILGSVDASTGGITGTVSAGATTAAFVGLSEATSRTDRLVNISSRLRVVSGDSSRSVITGFVVTGRATRRFLVRAVGPGLSGFGVGDALTNPRLQLYSGSALVAENDDWSNNADVSTTGDLVGAFKLNAGSRDSALVANLAPGAYTAVATSDGGGGVALIEVYDAASDAQLTAQHLVNISTRGFVEPGEGSLIAGFVVSGNAPKRVLVRGIGPGLTQFGVTGVLIDPQINLYSGELMATNDDWETGNNVAQLNAATAVSGAFALVAGSKDAALIVNLAPGAYTVRVSGVGNAGGVALVEVYDLP